MIIIQKTKKYILDKLNKIIIILSVPGSLKARLTGIYFELYQMLFSLKSAGINPKTIIDVGANRGMFSKAAHYIFPKAKIIAFEPLKDIFYELNNLSNEIENFESYNIALGEKSEISKIHRSSYDYSSSILKMSDIHKKAYPYSAESTAEKIQVKRLDEILTREKLKEPVLLKIDVQGFEKDVILGATGIIENITYIICELSFIELYENQPLFDEMYSLFINLGYKFMGYVGESKNPQNGQLLQMDALFIKN